MTTDPLLQLSIEALTQLTNAGLVKRAQRELESAPPTLERGADGVLEGRFADGTVTRFAPGAGVREATCSCAAALCRHRLIVVLGWQRARANDGSAATAPLASPGACDDERLREWAGAAAWTQATRLRSAGLLVDLEPGPPPVARLPQATVHFHGGDDPAAAMSDAQPAEHRVVVVLGVWAFRQADEKGNNPDSRSPDSRSDILGLAATHHQQIQLGGRTHNTDHLSTRCATLLASLLRHGLAEGSARHAPALAAALEAAQRSGATWLALALQALEHWLAAFEARSARFVATDGITLLAEIAARCRAGRGAGALAAQHALGIGEAMETALARVRLRCLGVRISGDGEQRSARVALLDSDTATRNALTLDWDNGGQRGAASVARAAATRAGGQTLAALAHGQLVTVSAHRRADGALRLGAAHGGRTSLLPQSPDWSDLPATVVVGSLAQWSERRTHLPPSLLQPRHALARFVVLDVRAVAQLGYDAAAQSLHAVLADHDDGQIYLQRSHASAVPGALDALARVLDSADPPRWIAGTLSVSDGGATLDPWALSDGQTLTVPDLAMPDDTLHDLPLAPSYLQVDPLQALLRAVAEHLAQRLLGSAGPRWTGEGRALVIRLNQAGCATTAAALDALLVAISDDDADALARCAGDLLLRLALAAKM